MSRTQWRPLAVLLAVLLPLSAALGAPASAVVLPANQLLLGEEPEVFHLAGQAAAQADAKIITTQGPGFDRAWRIEVRRQPQAEFQLQLLAPVGEKLNRGDIVLLSMWARATDSSEADHQGRIGLILEQSADPFDKAFARRFDLGPDWQRLNVAAKVKQDFAKTGAQIALRLGYFKQTVELANITLRRFDPSVSLADLPQTPLTYRGREPNAAWRTEAEQRIEHLRKSALTVHVTDSAGQPVSGASVRVRMLRHAFAFGSAYNDARFPIGDGESPETFAYQQHFTELFNTGVDEAGMKWPSWQDPAKRQSTLHALQWMHDHGIAVRGHCLLWPGWRHLPTDLRAQANDPAALEHQIDGHIHDVAGALSGQVIEWDVVNEPYLNNDLMHALGDSAMTTWFKLARDADSSARLYLNENNVPDSPLHDHRYDALYDRAHALLEAGTPLSGIGMQAHFSDGLTPPADLLSIYDRFATLGVPIRITELDIDVADEQLQADYFRDFLIASFSDPEINGIVLWGFWEAQHWKPDAALFRKDWSIKPNGQVWKDLVLGKWWTHADGATAADGTYSSPAFLGDYEVKVTAGQRSRTVQISLPAKGATADVQLN